MHIDLDNPRGAIRDFIAQEPVQREIAAQFKNLLRNYADASGDLIYRDRMRDMCTSKLCSEVAMYIEHFDSLVQHLARSQMRSKASEFRLYYSGLVIQRKFLVDKS